jgi:type I pullulanase
LFSNPDNGEKSRDFLHYDGCFYSYNRYLRSGVIDGRWDSPSNCPAFPKKLRVLAEGRGGPVWGDRGFVDLLLQGGRNAVSRFTVDGTPANLSNGAVFPKIGEALTLEKQFDPAGNAVLCLFAQEASKKADECFHYYKESTDVAPHVAKRLGVYYTPEATTFSIWSPDRNSVELWLDGQTISMGYIGDAIDQAGVWVVTVPGDHNLKKYQFILDDVAVRDPYAVMVEAATDFAIVMDPLSIQPEGGWAPTPPLVNREDAVIYEMSVRDFTFSPTSGVSPELRGKFLGLVQSGAYLNKGAANADPSIKTAIDHLKELGVTHVQLMPVYDYATCSAKDLRNGPNCYNWGYDPENFNVPEERYSTKPQDSVHRVREFQTMVNELHKAGIRVILDVVYNHTWVRPWREADEGEKYFGDITGKYFLFDENGTGYQLTGTGNTIDPKDPRVYKYIQDSLEYWVRTYNIDGFRFDIAGVFDYQEITGWMTYLYDKFPEKNLLNYGEPYTALSDPDPQHFRLFNISKMTRADGKAADFGGFNFPYREALKGNNDSGFGGGFAFNDSYNVTTIINGLRGSLGSDDVSQSAFASDPVQTINYATSHDNLNLFDKINAWASTKNYSVSLDYKKRIQVFTNAIVLMSQGVPFLHSGEEFLRTKNGIPDSYQAADPVNKVDWSRKQQYKDVFDAYAQLVQARRRFAGLRLPSREEIEQSLQVRSAGTGFFEVQVSPQGRNRAELLILLNSGPDRDYKLPSGEWTLALEQGRFTQERRVAGTLTIGGTAVTLLYR